MIEHIHSIFREKFSNTPLLIRAPGRVNLIGEHTDYNEGFVLPAAVDKAIYFAMAPNGKDHCRLYAADLDEQFNFELSNLKRLESGWPNYLMGVVAQLKEAGYGVKGFDCAFGGDIPLGAGMSSSAALECGLAYGLNELFELELDRMQLALMAQKAEQTYAGVQCGIMDQFASLFGQEHHVVKLDCRSMEYEYVPFEMADYRIVLCNSGVSHSLADSEYNVRRQQCEAGVKAVQQRHPKVKSLRDVSMDMLETARSGMEPVSFQRCSYVIAENKRLQQACKALESGDLRTFGEKMYGSHDGLSRRYEVSCKELDLLVDFTRDYPSVLGARMMGGGFGGCTINLVETTAVADFCAEIQATYKAATGIALKVYVTQIRDGVGVL